MASTTESEREARGGARRAWRRGVLAGCGALAAMLAAASLAFACTSTMGPLTITPTSGKAGTVISTSATGLKAYPATYRLLFSATDVGGTEACMSSTTVLKTITTNTYGKWSNVTATIPSSAPVGPSGVCAMESTPVRNQTATSHAAFTVVL